MTQQPDNHPDQPAIVDVDVAEAHERISSGAMLLDVREPQEWAAGHADGAAHVPLADLDPHAYPAEREILTVCRSGGRSSKAARRLAEAGRNVVNVYGGMTAWAEAGFPVVTDDGSLGTVK